MLLALFIAGCTNSGLGLPPSTAITGDTADEIPTGPCPWVGEWTLSAVSCGAFTSDSWFVDHDAATMTIAQHATSGCALTIAVSGPSCARVESWQLGLPVGTEADATYEGIDSCDPDACSFSGDEPACATGGGNATAVSVRADDSSGDLVLDTILGDTLPSCGLVVLTTWTSSRR